MAPQDVPTVTCVLHMVMVMGTALHRAAWSQDAEMEGRVWRHGEQGVFAVGALRDGLCWREGEAQTDITPYLGRRKPRKVNLEWARRGSSWRG